MSSGITPGCSKGVSVLFLSLLLSLLTEVAVFCELWVCIKAEGMQTFAIPPKRADLLTAARTTQPDSAALHIWDSAMRHFHPSDIYQFQLAAKLQARMYLFAIKMLLNSSCTSLITSQIALCSTVTLSIPRWWFYCCVFSTVWAIRLSPYLSLAQHFASLNEQDVTEKLGNI